MNHGESTGYVDLEHQTYVNLLVGKKMSGLLAVVPKDVLVLEKN